MVVNGQKAIHSPEESLENLMFCTCVYGHALPLSVGKR